MNKFFGILLFSCICLISCNSNTDLQERLLKSETALEEKTKALEKLMAESTRSGDGGMLVHVVYFDLKPTLTKKEIDTFKEDINQLKAINFLKGLEIGMLAESGDSRMLSEFEMMMKMSFNNLEELAKYQAHEVHLALKKKAKNYLAAPPRVYDYWKK